MKNKRNIIRGMKYTAILLVTFVAFVLVINLSIFDEKLRPEVAAMFEKQQVTIEPDNAYIAIWGITADNEKDFIEAGVELMERHREITSKDERSVLTDLDLEQILGGRDLDRAWLDQYKSCRSRTRNDCLKEMSELLKINPINDSRLLLMLERYSRMVKLSKYQHIMENHFASLLPSYSGIMRLSQIRVANIYLKKDTMNTLSIIDGELKFWRIMLNESGDMLEKMIAVASIWRNYSYLSEIIKTQEISNEENKKILSMTLILSKKDRDMTMVFYSEIKGALFGLVDMMSSESTDGPYGINSVFISPLWQKNATLNEAYFRNLLPLICLSKLEAKEFYQFKLKSEPYCKYPTEEDLKFYNLGLYNPVGKIAISIGIPAYPNYIARVHDLNGVISLVKLQLELKSVTENGIEEVIKNSLIRNHYTGEAMTFDKEKNEIGFDCLDKSSVCKISL